jgi:hypothetical protein
MNRKKLAIVTCILTVLIIAFVIIEMEYSIDGLSNEEHATFCAVNILKSCHAYAKHPDTSGQPPMKLTELIEPKFGGRVFLDGGQAALTDPWGKPFRYANVSNESGEMEYYVWSERYLRSSLSIHGAKLMTDGTVLTFGK